jgi:hypothetical protein
MPKSLVTWVDVEQELRVHHEAQRWPEGLVWAEAYWTGVRLHLRAQDDDRAVRLWLTEIFASQLEEHDGALFLRLESGALRVDFEVDEQDDVRPRYRPSFERPSRVPGPKFAVESDEGSDEFYDPPLVVFHSYKGGVGRTTHALAFALEAVAYTGGKVLLVDGDFEAPGLSWYIRERYPDPNISYADLLILAHGDDDPEARATVDTVAERLTNQEDRGMYVLPSFRESFRWEALEIRPDHLMTGRSPFAVSTLLTALGRKLGVQAIVVDLRAGLSELSAGLLLDPRVFRILVTSVGEQSLRGVEAVARQLRTTLGPQCAAATHFVISHVPPQLRESELLVEARDSLVSALSTPDDKIDEGDASEVVVSEYMLNLVTLPLEWGRALDLLESTGLPARLRALVERSPLAGEPSPSPEQVVSIAVVRRRLAERAEQQVFAETGAAAGFLRIDPLTRLAQDHRTRLPVAVVTGAKGAGKTYTFFQLIYERTWSAFTAQALKNEPQQQIGANVVPLIEPRNVADAARAKLVEVEAELDDRFGAERIDTAELRERVREKIESKDSALTSWRNFWLDAMAWRLGHRLGVAGAGEEGLAERLRATSSQVVFVIDGLEDLFQDFQENEIERLALRALLQDVPERLGRMTTSEVGLIILVRPDLVQAAIAQNAQQFQARYRPYALRWSQDAALKLAIWLAVEARALTLDEGASGVAELSEGRRDDLLIKLWGAKLGGTQSREARSQAWVVGVLSDFDGQIQARDVVRLVHHAAKRSIDETDGRFDDRLLDPRAMRKAVQDWGEAKIDELAEEDNHLAKIFEALRSVPQKSKQVPFQADELGLDKSHVEYLRQRGILYDDNGKIYITELVRVGLGFEMGNGARPRIVSLRRKILRSS